MKSKTAADRLRMRAAKRANERKQPRARTGLSTVTTWMQDEKFWRDVATRAIAGLIVVAVSYLLAILWGYVESPFPSVGFTYFAGGISLLATAIIAYILAEKENLNIRITILDRIFHAIYLTILWGMTIASFILTQFA